MRPLPITLGVVSTVLLGLSVWGCMGLTRHVIVAVDKWGDASPASTLVKVNATLDAVNAPCVDFHGSWTCGPIQQLSQTEKNVGILAARSARQVQQTGVLVTAVAHNLDTVGVAIKETAGHVNGTADAAAGTFNAATGTLNAGASTLNSFKPLVLHMDTTASDLDALLASPDLSQAIQHLNETSGNVAGITDSVDKMTLHLEKQVDSPKPLWKTAIPMAETTGKLYTCLVYHVCVN